MENNSQHRVEVVDLPKVVDLSKVVDLPTLPIKVNSDRDILKWQLRVIFPQLSWSDLNLLTFVYTNPTEYRKIWVDEGFTASAASARQHVYKFEDKKVLISKKGEEGNPYLHPNIVKYLDLSKLSKGIKITLNISK